MTRCQPLRSRGDGLIPTVAPATIFARVADNAIGERPEGYIIKGTGELITYADSRIKDSPDGVFHWCSVAGANDGHTICLFVPQRGFLISQRIPPIQLRAIMDPKDLSRAAADVAPGATETLNVWRNGKAMQISAAVGRNSDDAKALGRRQWRQVPSPKIPVARRDIFENTGCGRFRPQQTDCLDGNPRLLFRTKAPDGYGCAHPARTVSRARVSRCCRPGRRRACAPRTGRSRSRHGPRPIKKWNWAEFNALPLTKMTRDIHCVTAWTKFDTAWQGVLVDDILADAGIEPPTAFTLAHSFDGYTTNVPVEGPHRRQGDGGAAL